jgi:hypothetical protein
MLEREVRGLRPPADSAIVQRRREGSTCNLSAENVRFVPKVRVFLRLDPPEQHQNDNDD